MGLGVVSALLVWFAVSHRGLSTLLGIAILIALISGWFHRRVGPLAILLALWVAVSVSPLELTMRNVPGPPRIVPLVMGTLTDEGVSRETRGDLVGGGCFVSGLEPKWVVVW